MDFPKEREVMDLQKEFQGGHWRLDPHEQLLESLDGLSNICRVNFENCKSEKRRAHMDSLKNQYEIQLRVLRKHCQKFGVLKAAVVGFEPFWKEIDEFFDNWSSFLNQDYNFVSSSGNQDGSTKVKDRVRTLFDMLEENTESLLEELVELKNTLENRNGRPANSANCDSALPNGMSHDGTLKIKANPNEGA